MPFATALLVSSLAVTQLPEGVTELTAVDALASRLSQARVVALGEPAPGTIGFSEFETRVVQQLVEQHRFRALLMENSTNDRAIAQYFETCEPAALLQALYENQWLDNHMARVALYSWLCTYNRAHPEDPVRVVAYSPQKPWHDAATLTDFAKAAGSADFTRALSGIRANCYAAGVRHQADMLHSPQVVSFYDEKKLNEGEDAQCVAALASATKALHRSNDALRTKVGALRFGDARLALANLTMFQSTLRVFFTKPWAQLAALENQMADTVLWYLSSRGQPKSIIIAQTRHVGKTPVPYAAHDSEGWNGLVSMGTRLERALGRQYASVALTSRKVSAMFGVVYPAPSGPTSLDATLDSLRAPGSTAPLWVDTAAPFLQRRPVWALHDGDEPGGRSFNLPKAFDAVVSFPKIEAAAALGSPAGSERDGGR